VLAARGLTKSFPGVRAVDGVDLELVRGEVHGLVGENGAGKSTLVKMLAGACAPDAGEIRVRGERVRITSPLAARRLGVAAIYQEPNIVPKLSPVANVFLGQEAGRLGVRREARMRARFKHLCEVLAVEIPLTGPAGRLSIGAQQSIEIMRALERDASLLIMDEPTAALSQAEIASLHSTIGILVERGTAIVLISHKLEEVLTLCRTITVMRDGRKVQTTPTSEIDVDGLVAAMLDSRFEGALERARTGHRDGQRREPAAELLRITGLSVPGRLTNVSLAVGRGEILGVAGLVGAGRTTLLRALAGLEPASTGAMALDGRPVRWPTTPRRAHRLGIALAPEDRRTQGLVLSRSGGENVVLPSLRTVGTKGFATRRTVLREAGAVVNGVGFASDRLGAAAGTLSGGNQQKLVLAKWLRAGPRVLLVDEPARGIDVGAKAEIFALLQELSKKGMGVVIVSEELEELAAFADRVLVLCRGSVAAGFDPSAVSLDEIGRAMFPVS
jgi:ABC-type sugar transport system ATPase subunit